MIAWPTAPEVEPRPLSGLAAPSSRILLICRNPLDTVASLNRRYGRLGKSLRRWSQDNAHVVRWREHPQAMLVRYESTRMERKLGGLEGKIRMADDFDAEDPAINALFGTAP